MCELYQTRVADLSSERELITERATRNQNSTQQLRDEWAREKDTLDLALIEYRRLLDQKGKCDGVFIRLLFWEYLFFSAGLNISTDFIIRVEIKSRFTISSINSAHCST